VTSAAPTQRTEIRPLPNPPGRRPARRESGIGDSSFGDCKKFGAWDPPARDPAHTTEAIDVGHTYAQPGTYTATFSFEAGPFECVDSVTDRGDRPYASSATATLTVVVK
jgi:hypothetical protein